jgi:O-antigen ligase
VHAAPRPVPTPVFAVAALGAAAAVGSAAATLRSPALAVAAVLAAAFVALALGNIAGAAAVFVACTFVEQLPGAGSGVTVVKGLGAVVAFGWVVALLRGTISIRAALGGRMPLLLGASGLVACALVSTAWAADPRTAVDSAVRLGQGAVLAVTLLTCLAQRRGFVVGVGAFVVGAAVSAVLGLAGVGAAEAAAGTPERIGGGLADPNYLAAVLVPGIVLALGIRATTRGRLAQLVAVAAAAVMVIALFRTESRGGIVALAASTVAAVVVGGRLRRQLLAAAVAVVAAAALYISVSPGDHRLLAFGGGGSGRTELWSVAYDVFRNHPVGGAGAGNFSVVEPRYVAGSMTNLTKPYQEVTLREVVHNTYLHVLAELGVVGLVLLLVLVGGTIWIGVRAAGSFARQGETELETLTRALVIGGIGMFAAFAFLTAQYEKQLWVVVGLVGAAAAIAASVRDHRLPDAA